MTRLAPEIAVHIVVDQGAEQLLRRLSDPFWFQTFGCVLGFDWALQQGDDDALALDLQSLVYASRMTAKIDSAAVQDG